MDNPNENRPESYESFKRLVFARMQQRQRKVTTIEELLGFLYEEVEDSFWNTVLDQMTDLQQEEFAELLFNDLLALFHAAEHQEQDTQVKVGYG
jgi:hypothetical protein